MSLKQVACQLNRCIDASVEHKPKDDFTGLYLIIDDRERKIVPFIKKICGDYSISYKIARLTVGDYAIMYNGHILAIIERKTWKDMAASIKDGRSKNVEKLKSVERETKCTVFYFVEGVLHPNPKHKTGHIPYKNLVSHMDHLQIRDNIHLIQTRNKEATARRLFTLTENIGTLKVDFFKELKKGGGEQTLKKKIPAKEEEIVLGVWKAIPFITFKTAKLFIDAGYTIKQLIKGDIKREEIAMLEYPSGTKIGQRAKKILAIIDAPKKHYVNLLAAIPLISKNTAKVILEIYDIQTLLNLSEPLGKIKDIQKTKKTKIGQAAANNLIKFLLI